MNVLSLRPTRNPTFSGHLKTGQRRHSELRTTLIVALRAGQRMELTDPGQENPGQRLHVRPRRRIRISGRSQSAPHASVRARDAGCHLVVAHLWPVYCHRNVRWFRTLFASPDRQPFAGIGEGGKVRSCSDTFGEPSTGGAVWMNRRASPRVARQIPPLRSTLQGTPYEQERRIGI